HGEFSRSADVDCAEQGNEGLHAVPRRRMAMLASLTDARYDLDEGPCGAQGWATRPPAALLQSQRSDEPGSLSTVVSNARIAGFPSTMDCRHASANLQPATGQASVR